MMQVIPNREALRSHASSFYHNIAIITAILGVLVLDFFAGAAWQNGKATVQVVKSVQTQYQGKLQYHQKVEKVIAKAAKDADDACNHNLDAAIANDASIIRNCPPLPPPAKALAK